MRLHLVLLALALGCATADSKTDDTSSNGGGDGSDEENGSGDDGDGGLASLISDVAEMVTEMAELSATIAAQQATIAQLEMEMGETLRWETVEHTCIGEDVYEAVGLSSVGAVSGTAFWQSSRRTDNRWQISFRSPDLEDDGTVTVYCNRVGSGDDEYSYKYWLVTVGYER